MNTFPSEEKRVRQRITEAAFEILAEEGFSNELLANATAKTGYEAARVEPFFSRSEELVFALYLRLGYDWENSVNDLPSDNLTTRFRAAMLAKFEIIAPHRAALVSVLPYLFNPRHELGALSPQTEIVRLRSIGVIGAVVEGATDRPNTDTQTLVHTLYHAHLVLILLWCRDRREGHSRTLRALERVCNWLEKGLFEKPLSRALLAKTDRLIQTGFHLGGSEETNQTARAILKCIFQHRRLLEGSTGDEEADFALHLPRIRRPISLGEPVSLVLPAFPAKSPSPNKTVGVLPDMAEEIALFRLEALCSEIARMYAPGARIIICSDGHVFSDLVGVTDNTVTDYGRALQSMIVSLGLSHIDTFNMSDIFDGSSDEDRRRHLVMYYADSPEVIKKRIHEHPNARKLFDGIHRFLFEDASGLDSQTSRTKLRRETKERAYYVISRSEAWGRLLSECFPLALRLSIHPQPHQSDKIGILLGPANDVWLTPWHGTALETSEGFRLVPRHEAEALHAQLVYREGRPYYFTTTYRGEAKLSTQNVRQARDEFLQRHKLGLDTYSNPKFAVKLWGHVFWTPNPGLLPLHDLHHVATGFPATFLGESQISAYELRCGCGNALIFVLCVGAVLIGLKRQPDLIIAAWKNAKGGRSLYKMGISYEALMEMNVEELRHILNIPSNGIGRMETKG